MATNIHYLSKHDKERMYSCNEPFIGDVVHFQQVGRHWVVMGTACSDRDVECKYKNGTPKISPVDFFRSRSSSTTTVHGATMSVVLCVGMHVYVLMERFCINSES